MNHKLISVLLKVCIAAAVIIVLLAYCLYLPAFMAVMTWDTLSVEPWLKPWSCVLYPTSLPIFAAAVLGWLVVHSIGKDKCFTHSNAKYLKVISWLAFSDAAYFMAGNIVMLFMNMNHPGILIISMFISFAGAAIGIAFAALSHLTEKAALMQDDTDLTI